MADKEESKDSSSILINVKSTKEKMEINISPSKSVKELKNILKERLGSDVKGDLCLIFSGKILKDDETLESHGIVKDGLTLHLVLRAPKTTPTSSSSAASSSSSTQGTSSPTNSSSTTPSGGGGGSGSVPPPAFNPFGMMGSGGLPPPGDMQAQMQQLMNNPEIMQQILDSPMMQNLLANPDAFQALFTSNPQMQQLMERNPELSHILNNPDLMRQALEMARNPGAMREMMRSQDRQLSNIESLPGGFNALARMYSEIQEPMMDAAQESLQQQVQSNPFAALFSGPQQNSPQPGPSAPQGTANTAPLPNPWGSSAGGQGGSSNQTSQTSNQRPNGGTSTGTTGSTGGTGSGSNAGRTGSGVGFGPPPADLMRAMFSNPEMMRQLGSGQFQGMSPMELMQDPAYRQMYQQMMQNPEYRRAMMEIMSNPQAMQSLLQNVPGIQGMLGGQDLSQLTEQTAQMMNNPQMVELMSNPEAFQGYMNMMQGYQQMMQSMPGAGGLLGQQVPTSNSGTTGSTGGGSGGGGGGEGGSGASAPPPNNQAFLQMMQQMQQMMAGGQMGGATNTAGSGGQTTGNSGGGGSIPAGETQEQAAERRYRIQLETLERMGFPDRAANIQALMNSGGDINGAIDKLIKF